MIRYKSLANSLLESGKFVGGNYIGSCVDVGKGGKRVCDVFHDATEMAQMVSKPSNNEQIDRKTFFNHVNRKSVPKEAMDGETLFFYVTYSRYPGQSFEVDEASIFYIYNIDQDVHYFFEK